MIEKIAPENGRYSKIKIYDLFSGGQNELRDGIRNITDHAITPALFGPLYTITHELVVNALKAVYKKVFFEKFIVEIGLSDISYEQWLLLFKTEIEEHKAENFARVVREMGKEVEIYIRLSEKKLRITVINEGSPSEVELARIQKSLVNSANISQLGLLLVGGDDDDDDEEYEGDDLPPAHGEGASLGIPLIVLSLRKMGVDVNKFKIFSRGDRTFAGFFIPCELLLKYQNVKEL